jgi:hypothetical protein
MVRVIQVFQQPNESANQVLQRAKEELVRAVAPDRPQAFVMKFWLSGLSRQGRMTMYEGTVGHPCYIQHRHNGCGPLVIGHRSVLIYWQKLPEGI